MQHIFVDLSEFIRFFGNSKNRNLRQLGKSHFGGSPTGKNVIGARKIAKFTFFGHPEQLVFWMSKKHEFCDFPSTINVFFQSDYRPKLTFPIMEDSSFWNFRKILWIRSNRQKRVAFIKMPFLIRWVKITSVKSTHISTNFSQHWG